MTIFINGKQKQVRRPPMIGGMPVDEAIARNADPIWLHQNEMWELLPPCDETPVSTDSQSPLEAKQRMEIQKGQDVVDPCSSTPDGTGTSTMPFFEFIPSGPKPNLKSDPKVLAGLRKMVARHRVDGLTDAEIRPRLMDEMQASLPRDAVKQHNWRTLVADWDQVVDEVIDSDRPLGP